MPLKSGSSRETVSANIGELIKAGHSSAQAAAIAYKTAGEDCDLTEDEVQSIARSFDGAHDHLTIALDKSVRRLDADGRLHVEISNISKATVNGYYGREIPGSDVLGLSPDMVYQVFRPPEELAKGASTFNNLPLMDEHIIVSADDPKKDRIVGSTGTDAEFDGEFLRNSMVIWDADAITRIESGEQKEISCAYRYVADKMSGTYKGLTYSLVMRNIVGNHVALVPKGRAGPDVVVGDSSLEEPDMKFSAIKAKLAVKIAADAALSEDDRKRLVTALDGMEAEGMDEESEEEKKDKAEDKKARDKKAKDEETEEEEKAEDEESEEEKKAEDKRAKDKKARDRKAKDESEEEKEKGMDKAGMDAAISRAKAETRAETIAEMNAIAEAKAAVLPIVGEITAAMDSAASVYKFALDHVGVDLTGVPASAYRAMVKLIPSSTANVVIAQDAKSTTDLYSMFPNLRRISQG